MNYYIFRHSETYFSKNDIHYGNMNEKAEIIPEGIPATKKMSKYLASKEIDVFFTSPFERCVQTAKVIEKITGKEFIKDARIGEEMINYGKETFKQMFDRIKDFLESLESKKYKSVGICSHGWPIATLISLITKGKVTRKDLDNFPKSGVLSEIVNGKVNEINFNPQREP